MGAAGGGPWCGMGGSGKVLGVGRAVELKMALQAFAVTVEVDGALGGGQLAMQLGDLGGHTYTPLLEKLA